MFHQASPRLYCWRLTPNALQLDQLFQNFLSNTFKHHRVGIVPQMHVSGVIDGAI